MGNKKNLGNKSRFSVRDSNRNLPITSYKRYCLSQGSVVVILTRLWTRRSGVRISPESRNFVFSKTVPTHTHFTGGQVDPKTGILARTWSGQVVKLTTHLCLHGSEVENAYNSTFTPIIILCGMDSNNFTLTKVIGASLNDPQMNKSSIQWRECNIYWKVPHIE